MAKITTWDGSVDGDMSDPDNWNNGLPVATDDAIFDETASAGPTSNLDFLKGTHATATLTIAVTPADGETVTIGRHAPKVYTFKTTLTPTADEVLIGGSANAALDNLVSAVNLTGTPGTDYAADTTAPLANGGRFVDAAVRSGNDSVFTVRWRGLAGNSENSTETMTGVGNVWDNATFTGGVNLILNLLAVLPTCDYEIGTSDAPLVVSATKILVAGTETFNHELGGGKVVSVVVRSGATSVTAAKLANNLHPVNKDLVTSYYRAIYCTKGVINIGPNGTREVGDSLGTRLWLDSRSGSRPRVTVADNTPTEFINARAGTLDISGTSLHHNLESCGTQVTYGSTAGLTGVTRINRGSLIYNSTGTMAELELMSGIVDLTQSGGNKTITLLRRSSLGTLLKIDDVHTITTEIDAIGGD